MVNKTNKQDWPLDAEAYSYYQPLFEVVALLSEWNTNDVLEKEEKREVSQEI